MPAKAQLPTILRFGVFELDLETGELRKAGVRLRLQKQPFQVLKVLLQHPGDIVSREELRSEVWSDDTFVDFDNSLNTAVNKLRDLLGDTSNNPRFIETIPRNGYRFIAPVSSPEYEAESPTVAAEPKLAPWKLLVAGSSLVVILISVVWYARRSHPTVERNTILIGEFVNRTGDPVFDESLRQGLSVQLEQSPQLRVVADEQIRDTLRMMGRTGDSQIPPQTAREVCERNNASVALDGAISLIGTRYDLILRAEDCSNGNLVASAEAQAPDKNDVLDAVTKLASRMREQLGESLSSVSRYNQPLASATTSSLEALRCYTQGMQRLAENFDYNESLSWFQKAVELDSNFAMAYWAMGDVYAILGETNDATRYTRKAFDLKERASERERALIEANYYYYVVGDVEKARRSCELLASHYPYSEDAHTSIAAFAETVGQLDVGLREYQEALRLSPRRSFLYRDLAYTYLALDRVEDASAVVQRAHAVGLDANLKSVLYSLAFYQNNRPAMAELVQSGPGKPEVEDLLLALDADTAAYFGHLSAARTLSRTASESAERAGRKETSALYFAASALRDALFGQVSQARQQAVIANGRPGGRDVAYGAALALLYAQDLERGQTLTDQLEQHYPDDTVVKCNYLPTLRAKIARYAREPSAGA